MKVKICYNVEKIKAALEKNGYAFVKLPIVKESEDWGQKTERYYFAKPEVVSVDYYYGFWTSAVIKLHDGSTRTLYGPNINTKDETLLRINNNDFISPELKINDVWIEANDNVTNWLIDHGASMELLESSKQEFAIYETIEYFGVPTPSKSHGYWGYSSETLVLDEKEIEEALNSIENELLRKKIECILYARVFKRNR